MKFKGLTLDKFQVDAIESIDRNESVMVNAPTGSGKTLVAEYIVDRDLKEGKRVIYTAPIKALSNQKYSDFVNMYGGASVGLLTGDVVINPTAPILIMTTEVYRNMVVVHDPIVEEISYVIFDEIHFISDIDRGTVWEESIIFSPEHIRFCCLSATIPNAKQFAGWIESIKKHKVLVVTHRKRPVPLEKLFYEIDLGVTTIREILEKRKDDEIPEYSSFYKRKKKRRIPTAKHFELVDHLKENGELPTIFFSFGRADCQRKAEELGEKRIFLTPEQQEESRKIISDYFMGVDQQIQRLKTTKLLKQLLPKGIGFHHAGLLPVLKHLVEKLFSKKLIYVLYATETFAVGINMPAKTVCFSALRKFDGREFRYLNSKEYFQLAGRAGRRGIDKTGKAIAIVNRQLDDLKKIKRFTTSDSDPIKSQFKVSANTVVNLLSRNNRKQSLQILGLSFYTYQRQSKESVIRRFDNIHKKLNKLGYLDGDNLTKKGMFIRNIFVNELTLGEIFGTDFYKNLNEFQIIVLLSALVYEHRTQNQFSEPNMNADVKHLLKVIRKHAYLKKVARLKNIPLLSGLMTACFQGVEFGRLLSHTSWLEGDLLRFLRQIIDRIAQIRKATDDPDLKRILEDATGIMDRCLEGIDAI